MKLVLKSLATDMKRLIYAANSEGRTPDYFVLSEDEYSELRRESGIDELPAGNIRTFRGVEIKKQASE